MMKLRLIVSYFIFFHLFLITICHSQVPQEDKMMVRIVKETWIGAVLQSNGLGLNYSTSKFITYKKKKLLNIDLINISHDKEYKIFGSFDESAKKFIYGKLNSLFALRVGWGQRKIIFEKLRDNGLQLSMNYSLGPSIGFLKPVYLEVFKYNNTGQVIGISLERYDPELHNFYNIYGRGPWSAGIMSTKLNLGGFLKFGLEFEFANTREIINALEVGLSLDAFMNPISIMINNSDRRFYPSMYLSCSIGNKFY